MKGAASRRKGFGFEREVVNQAKGRGVPAKRAWGSDGRTLGLSKDVDVLVGGRPFQCKRMKKIAARLKPADGVFGQIVREDRGETLVVLRFEDYLDITNYLSVR